MRFLRYLLIAAVLVFGLHTPALAKDVYLGVHEIKGVVYFYDAEEGSPTTTFVLENGSTFTYLGVHELPIVTTVRLYISKKGQVRMEPITEEEAK